MSLCSSYSYILFCFFCLIFRQIGNRRDVIGDSEQDRVFPLFWVLKPKIMVRWGIWKESSEAKHQWRNVVPYHQRKYRKKWAMTDKGSLDSVVTYLSGHVFWYNLKNQVFKSFQHRCLMLFQRLLILLFLFKDPHLFSWDWVGGEMRKLVFLSLSLMGKGVRGLRWSFTSPPSSLPNRIVPVVNSSDYKHTH